MGPIVVALAFALLLTSGGHGFSLSSHPSLKERHVACWAAPEIQQIHANESHNEARLTSSRRHLLVQAAGALSTVPVVAEAYADPSVVSKLQGPVQDAIAPGHWLGQWLGLNSKTARWEFPASSPKETSAALVEVLNELSPERKDILCIQNFEITRADPVNVHARTWTKSEWLDTLDVSFASSPIESDEGSIGCVAEASFYATGFLPTSIPGAPVFNIGFAWFPFASPGPRGEMLQDFRLRVLQGLVKQKLQQKKMPRMTGL